jgi:hypothetical protein
MNSFKEGSFVKILPSAFDEDFPDMNEMIGKTFTIDRLVSPIVVEINDWFFSIDEIIPDDQMGNQLKGGES